MNFDFEPCRQFRQFGACGPFDPNIENQNLDPLFSCFYVRKLINGIYFINYATPDPAFRKKQGLDEKTFYVPQISRMPQTISYL